MAEYTLAQQQALAMARARAAQRARMAQQPTPAPAQREYALTEVPGAAVSNIGPSAVQFGKGMVEAVSSPIQTGMSLWDAAAGGLRNALPEGVVNFIDQFDSNPENTQRAVQTANAVGGVYKDRYGDYESIKRTFAEDPVGAAADLATILSGGGAAAAKVGLTKTGAALTRAGNVVNPATIPVAAAGKGIQYGVGRAIDVVSGRRPQIKAGNIIRNALTEGGRTPENMLMAREAVLRGAPEDTVRQALATALPEGTSVTGQPLGGQTLVAPMAQRLGEAVQGSTAPGAAMVKQRAQEAARMQALQGVTPDLATAEAMRGTASRPLYQAATNPGTGVLTTSLVQGIDDIIAQNPGNTKLVSALNQVRTGLEASTDAKQVSSVLDNLKDLIANKDNKFIVSNLRKVKDDVSALLPGYRQADDVFRYASGPVNQATVLAEMQSVLQKPLGAGERATAFMNALGRGEKALLKRSTGQPRFIKLEDVLTPTQMEAVGGVQKQLLRDADMNAQAVKGAAAIKEITSPGGFRLPNFLNAKVVVANEILDIVKGSLNARVFANLERAFNSNADFVQVMNAIPASQRIEVLRAIGSELSPTKLAAMAQYRTAAGETANEAPAGRQIVNQLMGNTEVLNNLRGE